MEPSIPRPLEGWRDRWVEKVEKVEGVECEGPKRSSDRRAIAGVEGSRDRGFEELTIQHQVKYEKDVGCGGGYMKSGLELDDLTTTHLIFHHEGINVLEKSDLSYKWGEDAGISHLRRMVLKRYNSVRVEFDEEQIVKGFIKKDGGLKPEEAPDPDDKEPADWVDSSMMDDPEEKKPDDWVEEKRIVDESAAKLDNWDDEEDGEWEAPMEDDPAYKGNWIVKGTESLAYKGIWEAKKNIVHSYADFGFLEFHLWQVKGGTVVDIIILCDDVAEADAFAKKWRAVNEVDTAKNNDEDEAKKAE
ncbi:unnamed protein product, partial [Prorocentrum cordatum]